jgi:predicted ATP-dependent serine protease
MRIEEKKTGTFKCPHCGNKVLKQTGYCVTCKKKVKDPGETKKKKETILKDETLEILEIKEDVKIQQNESSIILEKGDRIEVLKEANMNNSTMINLSYTKIGIVLQALESFKTTSYAMKNYSVREIDSIIDKFMGA